MRKGDTSLKMMVGERCRSPPGQEWAYSVVAPTACWPTPLTKVLIQVGNSDASILPGSVPRHSSLPRRNRRQGGLKDATGFWQKMAVFFTVATVAIGSALVLLHDVVAEEWSESAHLLLTCMAFGVRVAGNSRPLLRFMSDRDGYVGATS